MDTTSKPGEWKSYIARTIALILFAGVYGVVDEATGRHLERFHTLIISVVVGLLLCRPQDYRSGD